MNEFLSLRGKLSKESFKGRFGVPAVLVGDDTLLIGLEQENREKLMRELSE